jgi:zinc protease
MAVIAVGDFDKAAMEKLIKDHFAKFSNRTPSRERTQYTVPDHEQPLASVATDKELPGASLQVIFKRAPQAERTAGDFRNTILGQVYDGMFNKRLQESCRNRTRPSSMGGRDGRWLGHAGIYPFAQAKIPARRAGLHPTEASRVRRMLHGHGLEQQKSDQLRWIERQFKERQDRIPRSCDRIRPPSCRMNPYRALSAISKRNPSRHHAREINKLAEMRMGMTSPSCALGPEREGVKSTESEVLAVLDGASKKLDHMWTMSAKPLIAVLPKAGKVVSERKIESSTCG